MVLTTRLFSGMTGSVEAKQFDQIQAIIEFNIRGALDRAQARAEMLADLPNLQRKLAAGDRAGLLADYGPMFKSQQDKYGVAQIQIQVAPGTTFLRFQAPENFGDDVTQTRPLVMAVMGDHVARKAPALGKTGPGLFGIVPVNDASGTFLGSLEVGLSFSTVLDNLKSAYGLDLVLFIDEERLRKLSPDVNKDILDERNRVGKYLKVHATHWELLQPLATSRDLVGVSEPRRYVRESMGVPYGVVVVPLLNAAGEQLGVIAVAQSFEASRAATGRARVWQGLLALFAIVILAGAILVVVRGMMLHPLGVIAGKFGDLAKGKTDAPIEDDDTRCAELAELAEHHETLRTKLAASSPAAPGTDE